jgi:hypothetical protein
MQSTQCLCVCSVLNRIADSGNELGTLWKKPISCWLREVLSQDKGTSIRIILLLIMFKAINPWKLNHYTRYGVWIKQMHSYCFWIQVWLIYTTLNVNSRTVAFTLFLDYYLQSCDAFNQISDVHSSRADLLTAVISKSIRFFSVTLKLLVFQNNQGICFNWPLCDPYLSGSTGMKKIQSGQMGYDLRLPVRFTME